MDRKNKKNVAVTAGLAAVLALSPVVVPVGTALAAENDSAAVQSVNRGEAGSKGIFDALFSERATVTFCDAEGKVIGSATCWGGPFSQKISFSAFLDKFTQDNPEYKGASWSYCNKTLTGSDTFDPAPWWNGKGGAYYSVKLVVPEANTIDVVYVDTVDDATETAEGVASDAWYKDPSDLGWSHEGLEFAGWTMTEQDDGFYLGEGDLKDMSDTTVRVYAQ